MVTSEAVKEPFLAGCHWAAKLGSTVASELGTLQLSFAESISHRSVFAKRLLPLGIYTSGEVIFAVYTGGATLAHMRSPGLSRRWADNARSVAVLAAYRATIDRLFQPASRIKSVSAPPSLNQAWAKECRN